MTRIFYRGSSLVLLIYDITNMNSLVNLERVWINDIKQSLNSAIVILVGNKADMAEGPKAATKVQVPKEKADEIVATYNLNCHYSVSAKSGEGIPEMTEYMAKALYHNNSLIVQKFSDTVSQPSNPKKVPQKSAKNNKLDDDMPLVYKLQQK
mmetsp:Transcript_34691/g.33874  ORF Transcript_34691/g.33874 Transcript_34691/m.33874 type:complete len:152 (+) Transcript_34691:461-916(+)|eukprot:CAMPEP_0170552104 /NCGR_PEP_ID=MMETSP0211-20121228/10064_1 /TAXON_ID=311385 /ORGANISM="Pseudokeronopsis sp., Strain OXSARD2" /LENGTH=151 /DNA_ID=CAMNT_0010859659 /DNA_START=375 /DNA_END=830 /DNA_ORIENTATION=-